MTRPTPWSSQKKTCPATKTEQTMMQHSKDKQQNCFFMLSFTVSFWTCTLMCLVLVFSCSWVVFPPSVFPFRPSPVLVPPRSTCSSSPPLFVLPLVFISSFRVYLCRYVFACVCLFAAPSSPVVSSPVPPRWYVLLFGFLFLTWFVLCFRCTLFEPCVAALFLVLVTHFRFFPSSLGFCISALFYWSSPFFDPQFLPPVCVCIWVFIAFHHNSTKTTSKDITCELQKNFAKTDISKTAEMHSANIDSDIRVGHPYIWVLRTGLVIDLIQQTTSFQTGLGSEKRCYTKGSQGCSSSGSVSLHYANFPDKRSNESEGEPRRWIESKLSMLDRQPFSVARYKSGPSAST